MPTATELATAHDRSESERLERSACRAAAPRFACGRSDRQAVPGLDVPGGFHAAIDDHDAGVVQLSLLHVLDGDVGCAGSEPDADRHAVADHGHRLCAATNGFVDDAVEALEDVQAALPAGHVRCRICGPAEDEFKKGGVGRVVARAFPAAGGDFSDPVPDEYGKSAVCRERSCGEFRALVGGGVEGVDLLVRESGQESCGLLPAEVGQRGAGKAGVHGVSDVGGSLGMADQDQTHPAMVTARA